MADLTAAAAVFEVTLKLAAIDNNAVQQERIKHFELATTVNTYALAEAALAALVTDIVSILEADIVEKTIRAVFPSSGAAVTMVGDVYKEAILTLRPAAAGDLVYHTIFSPADTLIAGNNVITTLPALGAYLDNFELAGDFRLSDGEAIAASNQIADSRVRKVAARL